MTDVLMIYPKLGSMDSFIVDIPLSIIYASADAVKRGYNVKAIDLRCERGDWKQALKKYCDEGVLLAGISVMTGSPCHYAREASKFIKEQSPGTKIVWGGPHATVLPETINEPFIDFLIRGYGSKSLADLIECLKLNNGDYSGIKGLSHKSNGNVYHNPRSKEFETIPFTDIPYHLLDVTSPHYLRSYMGKRMFPLFTSIGCPYKCSFCVHPTIYKEINGPKWQPHAELEVVGHMEHVIKKFNVTHICFIDDTSFPDINRMRNIFKIMLDRGIKVTLEFRGARINEIDRMDDDFLSLMVQAGTRVLMVGVESASDRILKLMQKGITKEQIIRVNQKLARYPEITPYYNFIYGTPGETYEDLLETKEVVLQILRDNPNAYIGFGGDWKPIPGSKMLEIAEKEYGFKPPVSLDDWIEIDSSDAKSKIVHSWYTKEHNNLIKLMQIASFVIDDKMIKESSNKTMWYRILRLLSRVYKPVALFRLRFNFNYFLIEYDIWRLMFRLMPYIQTRESVDGKD